MKVIKTLDYGPGYVLDHAKLKQIRKEKGMSLGSVCKQLASKHEIYIMPSHLKKIEDGKFRRPKFSYIMAIADIYGIHHEELITEAQDEITRVRNYTLAAS
jgi:transcriptional regulator with XRE-family HTH domain